LERSDGRDCVGEAGVMVRDRGRGGGRERGKWGGGGGGGVRGRSMKGGRSRGLKRAKFEKNKYTT
jgi:hypothetical protein